MRPTESGRHADLLGKISCQFYSISEGWQRLHVTFLCVLICLCNDSDTFCLGGKQRLCCVYVFVNLWCVIRNRRRACSRFAARRAVPCHYLKPGHLRHMPLLSESLPAGQHELRHELFGATIMALQLDRPYVVYNPICQSFESLHCDTERFFLPGS